jgi:hypothetical protein
MKNEFVTYEQALALKELGFDEPCIGYYYNGKLCFDSPGVNLTGPSGEQPLPLYQQAFRWFREKHELYHSVYADKRADDLTLLYKVHVYRLDEELSEYSYRWAKTYEKAEQACLDKLIEICKNK